MIVASFMKIGCRVFACLFFLIACRLVVNCDCLLACSFFFLCYRAFLTMSKWEIMLTYSLIRVKILPCDVWIDLEFHDLHHSESIQIILNRIINTLFPWLNRLIRIWIVSIFIWGYLNQFKTCLTHINLHSTFGLSFNYLNQFIH